MTVIMTALLTLYATIIGRFNEQVSLVGSKHIDKFHLITQPQNYLP